MSKRYIITLTAANRVGILAAVGTALDELKGNAHEVSQTVVQKFFTIILAVDFPDDRDRQVIIDHLSDVCRPFGVDICLKDPAVETLKDDADGDFEKYFLTVEGDDQPGILRHISGRLAEQRIDINDLYGIRDDAQGAFRIVLGLAVPTTVDVTQLKQHLTALGQSLDLSMTFEHERQIVPNSDALPGRLASSILRKREPAEESDA